MKRLMIAGAMLSLAACAAAPSDDPFAEMFSGVSQAKSDRIAATLTDKALGSAENPVRVSMPEGQRAYLQRLRCADGRAPAFDRIGSIGTGPYGMIVDAYDVRCAGSSPAASVVHMDMYHPTHVETRAPEGFTLTP